MAQEEFKWSKHKIPEGSPVALQPREAPHGEKFVCARLGDSLVLTAIYNAAQHRSDRFDEPERLGRLYVGTSVPVVKKSGLLLPGGLEVAPFKRAPRAIGRRLLEHAVGLREYRGPVEATETTVAIEAREATMDPAILRVLRNGLDTISEQHATISWSGDAPFPVITDDGSQHGTFPLAEQPRIDARQN